MKEIIINKFKQTIKVATLVDSFTPLTSNNVKSLIKYIEENFEKPLSVNLACGEEIDLDFFLSVNTVLNDLSLNSKKR